MKEIIRLVGVLCVICAVAGALLASVHRITQAPIEAAAKAETVAAVRDVLPESDNDPVADAVAVEHHGAEWTFYVAKRNGAFNGAAFETASPEGYGGGISVMVGVRADGAVNGIAILQHHETPGLGAHIEGEPFRGQFEGRRPDATQWAVRKDGGDIDQITAATISSRAVVDAVERGLDVYQQYARMIRAGGEQW